MICGSPHCFEHPISIECGSSSVNDERGSGSSALIDEAQGLLSVRVVGGEPFSILGFPESYFPRVQGEEALSKWSQGSMIE